MFSNTALCSDPPPYDFEDNAHKWRRVFTVALGKVTTEGISLRVATITWLIYMYCMSHLLHVLYVTLTTCIACHTYMHFM